MQIGSVQSAYFKMDTLSRYSFSFISINLQNITNDTDGPHIGTKGDAIKVNDFGCNKLGCAKQNLKWK